LLLCLGSFAVLETVALYNSWPNDTLTATTADNVPWYVGLAGLVAAFILAIGHWWRAYRDRNGMK
jgi:hypothetical protein